MAANRHRPWWTALMWNPGTVRLVEGSYRPVGAPDFWHGCTTARFDAGAREPILVAGYHGDPFRPDFRHDEVLRLKGAFRRTGGVQPGFCVGDFNAISAAEVDDGRGGRRFYDAEPYTDMCHDDPEFQVRAGTIGTTRPADRRQTETLLRRGFMVDAAAHLGARWRSGAGRTVVVTGDPWGGQAHRPDPGLPSHRPGADRLPVPPRRRRRGGLRPPSGLGGLRPGEDRRGTLRRRFTAPAVQGPVRTARTGAGDPAQPPECGRCGSGSTPGTAPTPSGASRNRASARAPRRGPAVPLDGVRPAEGDGTAPGAPAARDPGAGAPGA